MRPSNGKKKFSLNGQPKATSHGDIGLLQERLDQTVAGITFDARVSAKEAQTTKPAAASAAHKVTVHTNPVAALISEGKIYDSPVASGVSTEPPRTSKSAVVSQDQSIRSRKMDTESLVNEQDSEEVTTKLDP